MTPPKHDRSRRLTIVELQALLHVVAGTLDGDHAGPERIRTTLQRASTKLRAQLQARRRDVAREVLKEES